MSHDIRIHPDPQTVFAEALERGFLNMEQSSAAFAGRYMYMYHDASGAAHFKHIETRRYRVMPPAGRDGERP